MKIVNPKLGKFGEGLQIGELFMLWCDYHKKYNVAIIMPHGTRGRFVVCSAQQTDGMLDYFTVGQGDSRSHDLFQSRDEILSLFATDNYIMLYRG